MNVCQKLQFSTLSAHSRVIHVEMLSFRDFDAWLESSNGRPLKHGIPTIDRSKVSAVVKLKPKSVRYHDPQSTPYHFRYVVRLQLYCFCWRYTAKNQPISALSQLFIADALKQQRVVHVIMIDTRPVTLSRCSKGILELPFDKHEYLRAPDILGGGIYVQPCKLYTG